jgi:hypothetical protein
MIFFLNIGANFVIIQLLVCHKNRKVQKII